MKKQRQNSNFFTGVCGEEYADSNIKTKFVAIKL